MTIPAKYFNHYGFDVKSFPISDNTPFTFNFVIEYSKLDFRTMFKYHSTTDDNEFWLFASRRLISIFLNGQNLDNDIIYDDQSIKKFIDANYINLDPESKLDKILEHIHRESEYDGDSVSAKLTSDLDAMRMYFENKKEWEFYVSTALKSGYLNTSPSTYETLYSLTINGLSRIINILKGKESNICFIAMAFSDEMKAIYDSAISPTIIGCGYEPYIVIAQNIESDKTINDAIIAGIKKAKFTIADFTDHRNGVYFEAGFALGRGQKVIYTCREDHMPQSHFDLRNYQHIVWKNPEDLRKQLVDKIEAFIND